MAFTIKELETLSGIKAYTIRIWEQRYHFLKPARTTTNIRTYTNEELKTLLTVALLNRHGYKISRIDEMSADQRNAEILNIRQPDVQKEVLINELIGFMVDVKHAEFEEALNRHIRDNGLAETVTTVIFQFLERVGILWQTGCINPAQEHIVSNIIRKKIISATDALPGTKEKQPLFLLFLPEDVHHELGLLLVYYLLKERSLPVLYLGANLPMSDVSYVVKVKQPAFLYLHLTTFSPHLHFEKYIHELSSQCTASKILVSGNVTQHYQKSLPGNVVFFRSFQEFTSFLTTVEP